MASWCCYPQARQSGELQDRLDKDFLPLAIKFGCKDCNARDIPPWFGEGVRESLANHIVGNGQNWNACRRPLRGANCCISCREDHIVVGSTPASPVTAFHFMGNQSV